jgi:ABC-type nitrate/sulfonate/bicarbonate transport system substrate-binding protein
MTKKNLVFPKTFFLLLFMLVFTMSGCAGTVPVEAGSFEVYAPASTSSIPVLLAASQNENIHVTLYSNQEQANALFIRGEIPMMVTGLSVGQSLNGQGVPVQMSNSLVAGLSYLVTYGEPVESFMDLAGKEVYVPFAGSPIEEICAYFAAQEGLIWGEDITPVYAPFDSSVALLKEGKAAAVVLPEPFVSLVENAENVYVSISFYDIWNSYNAGADGYPQVGTFVNRDWAEIHAGEIDLFNTALADAIASVEADPQAAVSAVAENYKFPEAVLLKSLGRIEYNLVSGEEMQTLVTEYDVITGNEINESESNFYYLPAK